MKRKPLAPVSKAPAGLDWITTLIPFVSILLLRDM